MALLLNRLTFGALLTLIRWPNLVLVAICLLVFHRVLWTYSSDSTSGLTLQGIHLFLYILVATILTAAGYVINDLRDVHTDRINRPERILVAQQVDLNLVWRLYLSLVTLGFIMSVAVAWLTGQWIWLPLYPLTVACLYLYATFWKGASWFGNLLVALMTAILHLTLLLPEQAMLQQMTQETRQEMIMVFSGFSILAFTTSFYREWIKDMEDLEGDRQSGWNTWVVTHGREKARKLAVCWGLGATLPLYIGAFMLSGHPGSQLFMGIAAILQTRMLLLLIQTDYHHHLPVISLSCKGVLALGLFAVLSL